MRHLTLRNLCHARAQESGRRHRVAADGPRAPGHLTLNKTLVMRARRNLGAGIASLLTDCERLGI